MKRFLMKSGYAVRISDGTYRGVFRTKSSADLIAMLAETMEFRYFDPPVIERGRIWFWQRFGVKRTPVSS